MSNNDLQALFANIRPRSQGPASSDGNPAARATTSAQPSATTAFGFSSPPPFSAVNPAHMPNSPPSNTNTSTTSNAASAQSLLNLLNFGTASLPAAAAPLASPPIQNNTTEKQGSAPNVSASDLVARFMSPPAVPQSAPRPTNGEDHGGGQSEEVQEGTDSAQNALLKLLSKSKSSQSSRAGSAELARPAPAQQVADTAEATPSQSSAAEQASSEQPKKIFTYTNPFEALQASRNAGSVGGTPQPKPSASASFSTPVADRTASPSGSSQRKKLTPRSTSAKVERLARENSVRSNGTPEPVIQENEENNTQNELPIRSTSTTKAAHAAHNHTSREPVLQTTTDLARTSDEALSMHEKAAVASAEIGWDAEAKESPTGAADEWEDAEESPSPPDETRKVPVYNFPIRPFISISLQFDDISSVGIRENGVMEISRLRKDFDQLDRSLAAATSKYIAYALTKNGGMRIIRQDDGRDRQVFKHSHDRVFNVAFCTTAMSAPPSGHQAILGTGVSGTVYYATVSKEGNDLFEKNELDSEALSFPPWPPADENSAGGVLKTRAKRSSRHPEYFAIGRGKSIHIIWPETTVFAKYGITESDREVDMEKLYQERNLQIATGKAGKDFVFSEDDSMIISLDKTGRLRFWDIRPLTDETNATAGRVPPIKIDTPLLSLSTASPAEKSWPTSVLMVDKSRPYSKGGAQRYVLVGLRQNHTLQLWDIALGKAVQEVNFPHENETDGVCSVNYHPGSGIIVVGHPTRNSIFFIHLSAPRYTLSSSIDQASYVQLIAAKDPDVPKPDSTACMSGIREISFASKGQLRSVELLPLHKSKSGSAEKVVTDPLFELYAVHSKGVTCLTITKEDLGWDAGSKVIDGVDAVKAGIVTMKELKLGGVIEEAARIQSPPEEPSSSGGKSKKKSKKAQKAAEQVQPVAPEVVEPAPQPPVAEAANGSTAPSEPLDGDLLLPKETKKSKKKAAQDLAQAKDVSRTASPARPEATGTTVPEEPVPAPAPVQSVETTAKEPVPEQVSIGISGDWLDKEMKKLEKAVSKEFKKEMGSLYTNIQNDRLVQDSTASARQEAVLRLVSQTLTNNVEKSIANIVSAQIQQVVLPAITSVTSQAIQTHVGDAVARTMQQLMGPELGKHIPSAVQTVLTSTQFARSVQESVSQKLTKQLDGHIADAISRNVSGSLVTAAEQAAAEVEGRMSAQFRKLDEERRRDTARLEKLGAIVSGMAETLRTMSDTQVNFQSQILRDRQQLAQYAAPGASQQMSTAQMTPSPAPIARPLAMKPKSQRELEQDDIASMMKSGRYEDASIKWLNSEYQAQLFDNLFIRFTPEYLSTDVSALVAFSIAVTVSKSMENNLERRLEWINAALDAVDFNDREIAELASHAPQLVDSIISKVEALYMRLSEEDAANAIIRLIPPVARKARNLRAALAPATH